MEAQVNRQNKSYAPFVPPEQGNKESHASLSFT
jgi:hypothetical protein